MFGKMDSQLNELFMQFLDSCSTFLLKDFLKFHGHVGIVKVDEALLCFIHSAQVYAVPVGERES